MRLSQLFTRTLKENPKDETSLNAQILMRAGFIDKIGAGIYTFLPLGLRVHNNICRVIREEIDAIGGQEILMPALTPKEYWQITGRWENFDALFRLKGGDNRDYALGATHEEIVTPTVQRHVFSYKDLSMAVYQIQTKFRNELRSKAGLLRGREFSMKDLYSFHTDQKTLDAYYEVAQRAYFKIYERLGLLDITFLTYASGGVFSKYSHEFQTVCDAGEDTIHICDKCKVAVNQEIIDEQSACPLCGNVELRAEKAIEVGNIFKLGTRFSDALGLKYTDEHGKEQSVQMGSYGIGLGRLMAAVVEILSDDNGMVWPEEIAPFKAHLVELKEGAGKKLYEALTKEGIEVLYDDRDVSAGEKLKDADLIGIPHRLVVSEKTGTKVEFKKRSAKKAKLITQNEVIRELI